MITTIISLAIFSGIDLFLLPYRNRYVVDFMTFQGFHPEPYSKDFRIIDGIYILALDISFIGIVMALIIVSISILFMAITDTTFNDLKKKKLA
jgi:hypothetical protein